MKLYRSISYHTDHIIRHQAFWVRHSTQHTEHRPQHTAHNTQHTTHTHTTHNTQHTTHSTQHTAHSKQHTTHSKQHTAHSTHHTAHSTRHTAHSTQHTAHNTQHTFFFRDETLQINIISYRHWKRLNSCSLLWNPKNRQLQNAQSKSNQFLPCTTLERTTISMNSFRCENARYSNNVPPNRNLQETQNDIKTFPSMSDASG